MSTSTLRHKQVKRIKDDKFNIEDLHHYRLCLQFGERDFQMCIFDTRESRCLLLEDYIFTETHNKEEFLVALEKLFEGHHLLQAGFWETVRISLKSPHFALVPSALFDESASDWYLQLNANPDPEDHTLYHYRHQRADAVNVFAADKELADWVVKFYPNSDVRFLQQGSPLIESVLEMETFGSERAMNVFIDRFLLHVVVSEGRSLYYYNQFRIKDFGDYVRYIMTVMQELKMDQERHKAILWGHMRHDSSHYKELYKYIRNIELGVRPSYLIFGYQFDEVEEHQYMDLFGLSCCQ